MTDTPRTAASVRVKLAGGIVDSFRVGTAWRIARTDSLYEPPGIIGEDVPEFTIIDFDPMAEAATLDVEALARALDALWREKWGGTAKGPGVVQVFGAAADEIAAAYAEQVQP